MFEMTDAEFEEMEQAERKTHDEKVKELEQEEKWLEEKAEKYFKELADKKIPFSITNAHNCIKQAHKDGIKRGCVLSNELTKENAELKEEYIQTEKEYADLKIKHHDYAIYATDKIATLEAQIEKMKCCGNCKYCSLNDEDYDDVDENPCNDCYGFSEWELAE